MSPYSANKAGGELHARSNVRTNGLHVMIMRVTDNPDPSRYPERLIPILIIRALRDQPLQIYGKGTNIDIAKLILKHMKKPESLIEDVQIRLRHDFRNSLNWDRIRKIGWKPQVKFEDGLRGTVDWYLRNQDW